MILKVRVMRKDIRNVTYISYYFTIGRKEGYVVRLKFGNRNVETPCCSWQRLIGVEAY